MEEVDRPPFTRPWNRVDVWEVREIVRISRDGKKVTTRVVKTGLPTRAHAETVVDDLTTTGNEFFIIAREGDTVL